MKKNAGKKQKYLKKEKEGGGEGGEMKRSLEGGWMWCYPRVGLPGWMAQTQFLPEFSAAKFNKGNLVK